MLVPGFDCDSFAATCQGVLAALVAGTCSLESRYFNSWLCDFDHFAWQDKATVSTSCRRPGYKITCPHPQRTVWTTLGPYTQDSLRELFVQWFLMLQVSGLQSATCSVGSNTRHLYDVDAPETQPGLDNQQLRFCGICATSIVHLGEFHGCACPGRAWLEVFSDLLRMERE